MVIFRIFSSGGKFRLNIMKNLRGFGNLGGLAIMKNLRGFGNLGGLALNIIKRIGCGTRFVTPSYKEKNGGGGGTVYPLFSQWTGLFLHLDNARGERLWKNRNSKRDY